MSALFDSIVGIEKEVTFHWQCLFPVDNGAFFVIYIIHSAIFGNILQLLRITDIILYLLRYILLRSKAEYETAQRETIIRFPLGESYSQFIFIFTMTIIFSFASPLIVPFGK